jgi:hypothetical protein
MKDVLVALAITGLLFVVFVASTEIGYRIGARARDKERLGIGVIEGAVFGLLGLLLAFSFGTGIAHLDQRRQLIVNEANAIAVAYRRVDLVPAADRPELRKLFLRYVNARLAAYENVGILEISPSRFATAETIQDDIWRVAMRVARGTNRPQLTVLVITALNDMFDVETERKVALSLHNPALVLVLLVCVGLMTCVLGGYALSARGWRSWLHGSVYALTLALTIYTVIDLDNPRFGLINLNTADQVLVDTRDAIQADLRDGTR